MYMRVQQCNPALQQLKPGCIAKTNQQLLSLDAQPLLQVGKCQAWNTQWHCWLITHPDCALWLRIVRCSITVTSCTLMLAALAEFHEQWCSLHLSYTDRLQASLSHAARALSRLQHLLRSAGSLAWSFTAPDCSLLTVTCCIAMLTVLDNIASSMREVFWLSSLSHATLSHLLRSTRPAIRAAACIIRLQSAPTTNHCCWAWPSY